MGISPLCFELGRFMEGVVVGGLREVREPVLVRLSGLFIRNLRTHLRLLTRLDVFLLPFIPFILLEQHLTPFHLFLRVQYVLEQLPSFPPIWYQLQLPPIFKQNPLHFDKWLVAHYPVLFEYSQ